MSMSSLKKCKMGTQEDGSGSSKSRQTRKKQKSPPRKKFRGRLIYEKSGGEEETERSDGEKTESSDEVVAETSDEEEEADGETEEEVEESEQQAGACGKSGNPNAVNEKTNMNIQLAATITDADVFDCPICFENLRIPLHQCVNGHVACHSCCRKINKKCPTCSSPIEHRCRIMEKVLEAVQVSCGNLMYGCQHIMKLCDKREHEYKCVYTRCSCPMQDCDFVDSASKLYQHFGKKHTSMKFRFNYRFSVPIERNTKFLFLQENSSGTVFVLNQFTLHQGTAVSVLLIAPKSSTTGKYRCELEAKDGEESLSLESEVRSVTKLVDYLPTKYLVVVEDFLSPLGQVMLQIRIRRAEEVKGNSTKK